MGNEAERFFVVTGGPGSGKSTLIEALARTGFGRSVEAGRGIIQNQVAIGGRALPWVDPALFAEMMLAWEMRSYCIAQGQAGQIFFDRGVPDVAGYLRLMKLPIPTYLEKAIETFRYHSRVFITPPWEDIFQQDHERKQDFAEAIRTYESLAETYTCYGYELVELPRRSVEERARFVLERLGIST
ncbi:MAG TPA: AAA family ATPase [Terriglobales bacterium]|nr:AAA family ATPase [Terriglobales bacterium]